MRLLVDTHIFLWTMLNDARLPRGAQEAMQAAEKVYLSSASVWEIAIKTSAGKLKVDFDSLIGNIEPTGFWPLPIDATHAAAVRHLPDLHRDPFDRMLLAQAMSEQLRLLTADRRLAAYSDQVLIV